MQGEWEGRGGEEAGVRGWSWKGSEGEGRLGGRGARVGGWCTVWAQQF